MKKAIKAKKIIEQIIKHGNNDEIVQLHKIIFEAHQKEFSEDNVPTLIDFILENTLRSFGVQPCSSFKLYRSICTSAIDRTINCMSKLNPKDLYFFVNKYIDKYND